MQSVICLIALTVWIVAGDNNLALLRPATHSMNTDYPDQGPGKAVDGFNITALQCTYVSRGIVCSTWMVAGGSAGDCQSRPCQDNSCGVPTFFLWLLYLLPPVSILPVVKSPILQDGIPNNFRLDVFQDPQCPKLCAHYNGRFTEAVAETVYCSMPVRGRFVRFTQDSPIFLCEFEVYESREMEETVRDSKFVKQPGKKAVLPNPHEVQTTSVLQCARSCLTYGSCPFFNYRKLGGICEISYNVSSSGITVDAPDWSVFEQNIC